MPSWARGEPAFLLSILPHGGGVGPPGGGGCETLFNKPFFTVVSTSDVHLLFPAPPAFVPEPTSEAKRLYLEMLSQSCLRNLNSGDS